MSNTPVGAGGVRVRLKDPGRFHWHLLGQEDPEEVVVFDGRLGLTHRICSAAHDIHDVLRGHQHGLQMERLIDALLGSHDVDGQARAGLDRLIDAMVRTELLIVEPADEH